MDGEFYEKYLRDQPALIDFYLGYERFRGDCESAPEAYRNLFCGYWCKYEVDNGGLKQFFWNSTGIIAPEAVSAFKAAGLPKLAAVVRDSIAVFGPEFPRDRQARIKFIDERYPKGTKIPAGEGLFDRFDARFYDLAQAEAGGWDSAADAYLKRQLSSRAGKKSVAPKCAKNVRKRK